MFIFLLYFSSSSFNLALYTGIFAILLHIYERMGIILLYMVVRNSDGYGVEGWAFFETSKPMGFAEFR